MTITRAGRLSLSLAALAFTAASLAGCTGTTEPAEASPAAGGQEVLGSSITDLFEQYLGSDEISEFERGVLERAAEAGEISQADYDEAFNKYTQCTSDLGYEETWTKLSTGLYQVTPPALESQDAVDKYAEQSTDCASGTVRLIEALFNQQQTNPDLLADPRAVAVQCLLKGGFVDAAYTVDDFQQDIADPANASFDVADTEANTCLTSAGFSIAVG